MADLIFWVSANLESAVYQTKFSLKTLETAICFHGNQFTQEGIWPKSVEWLPWKQMPFSELEMENQAKYTADSKSAGSRYIKAAIYHTLLKNALRSLF